MGRPVADGDDDARASFATMDLTSTLATALTAQTSNGATAPTSNWTPEAFATTLVSTLATAIDHTADYADAYSYDCADCDPSLDYTPHERRLRSLWLYAGYPILAIGTIGHVLAIATLLARRSMRAVPIAIFLLPMSVAGLAALYAGLLRTIVRYQTYDVVKLEDSTGSEVACRLHMAGVYASLQLYSWMEACVAVERLTAVRWPHRYRQWFTRRRNAAVVSASTLVVLALGVVPFFAYGHSSAGFCEVVDARLFDDVWRHVHWAAYAALPVAVMLPCNALVLRTMCHPRLSRNPNVRKARPVTVMMLALNSVFVVTTLPFMVGGWSGADGASWKSEVDDLVWAVCRLFMYLGSASTFAVYLAIGAKFRAALRDLFESGKAGVLRIASVLSGGAFEPGPAESGGGASGIHATRCSAVAAAASAESDGGTSAATTEEKV